MILAHHGFGEEFLLGSLAAGGTTAATGLLAFGRAKLDALDCDPDGGMTVDEDFFVDFHPARAHEVRLQNGDCTTEIFP